MHLSVDNLREIFLPPPWNTAWVEWANRLPPSSFVVWLAGNVASDLCRTCRGKPEELVARVETVCASRLQHDAERFLRRTYFTYMPFCRQCQRMLRVFRHLLQNRIRRRFSGELA